MDQRAQPVAPAEGTETPPPAAPTTWRMRLAARLPMWLRRWLLLDMTDDERKRLDDEMRIW